MVGSLLRQMQLEPFFLGFDDSFNKLLGLKNDLNKHISSYPPYNIIKLDDDEFELEFAIAGFSKKDIKVTVDNGKLHVSGIMSEANEETEVDNGLLKIKVKKYIPKHLQPKEIAVK
jgi:HSP20 family molecular chaperone IbpA